MSHLFQSIAFACALGATQSASAQERLLTTPGMPGSADHHLDWADLKLEWGLGFDLRAPILLGGAGKSGEMEARVRAVDLVLRSEFNRSLWGYAMLSGEDVEAEETIALRRAVLEYTGLGGASYLRVGRLPIDFGKQMQARPYELPYIQRPLVLRNFLGDQIQATGLSYGDIFATSERSTLRASIGLFSDWNVQGDPLDAQAPGAPESNLKTGLRADDLALVARVSGVVDVGQEGMFQWGLSAQSLSDLEVRATQANGSQLLLEGQDQKTYGVDLSFGHADENEGPSWSAGWSGLLATGDRGARLGPGPSLQSFSGGPIRPLSVARTAHPLWPRPGHPLF